MTPSFHGDSEAYEMCEITLKRRSLHAVSWVDRKPSRYSYSMRHPSIISGEAPDSSSNQLVFNIRYGSVAWKVCDVLLGANQY